MKHWEKKKNVKTDWLSQYQGPLFTRKCNVLSKKLYKNGRKYSVSNVIQDHVPESISSIFQIDKKHNTATVDDVIFKIKISQILKKKFTNNKP
jgi:hypothetical protein